MIHIHIPVEPGNEARVLSGISSTSLSLTCYSTEVLLKVGIICAS